MGTPILPATWPVPIPAPTLSGNLIQLELLRPSHLPELANAGLDPSVWEFTSSCGDSYEAMKGYIDGLLRDWEQGSAVPFAVRRIDDGDIIGCTRLKEVDRRHRHAVVGSWYSPKTWRTGANLEGKLLLLDYAFRNLGCIRIEFHADVRNERSRKSLEKLGAQFEGVLRAHQVTRHGSLRDSAIYSIVAMEWSGIQRALTERLRRRASGV